jgi:hypothetical protein
MQITVDDASCSYWKICAHYCPIFQLAHSLFSSLSELADPREMHALNWSRSLQRPVELFTFSVTVKGCRQRAAGPRIVGNTGMYNTT